MASVAPSHRESPSWCAIAIGAPRTAPAQINQVSSRWPRPGAATSPERTCEWHPVAGQPQHHRVPAWAYQWLVAVPESDGSWVLPLDVPRRAAAAGTPTAVAIQQLRSARALQPGAAPPPVVVLDSGYDPGQLAQADLDVDCLVRLAQHRVSFRAPGRYRSLGRHRAPVYGHVRVDAWTRLHARTAPQARLTVVRVQVERLPSKQRPPQAPVAGLDRWVAPADLHQLWRWYLRRFVVEHAFRVCQTDARLDDGPSALSRRGRSVDLAGGRGAVAALAGAPASG